MGRLQNIRLLAGILPALLCMLMLTACASKEEFVLQTNSSGTAAPSASAKQKEQQTEQPKTICVHVCGAVLSPGVYTVPADARLYQAVEAAGGLSGEAAGYAVNLAAALEDGQQIVVPTVEEAKINSSGNMAADAGQQTDTRVDLNSATAEQLMTLSGIGESKAQAIIDYREEHGGFADIDELKNVNGIKDGTFQKIKEQITVR